MKGMTVGVVIGQAGKAAVSEEAVRSAGHIQMTDMLHGVQLETVCRMAEIRYAEIQSKDIEAELQGHRMQAAGLCGRIRRCGPEDLRPDIRIGEKDPAEKEELHLQHWLLFCCF